MKRNSSPGGSTDPKLLDILAGPCARLLHLNDGHVGPVARCKKGDLLTSGMNGRAVEADFQLKPGFPDSPLRLRMARKEVPGAVPEVGASLDECPRYGYHRSINELSHVVVGKIKENFRRGKILILPRNFEISLGRHVDCECPRW